MCHLKPVVVWIGVEPDTKVPYETHFDAVMKCKDILLAHDVRDVEIARQSRVGATTIVVSAAFLMVWPGRMKRVRKGRPA